MKAERLDKVLAAQSTWSRKDVKEMVAKGWVTLNGAPVSRGDVKLDPDKDLVTVYGQEIFLRRHLYLMMNKPTGVVSATRDDGCPTVISLVPPSLVRNGLFPAGRLDKDTTGMLLITDDGDLAHRILSPKNHIPKTYLALLDVPVTQAMADGFAAGIPLAGEDTCLPARLEIVAETLARVTICEGMYHQIKQMFGTFGATVKELRRISMGALPLDESLAPGQCRELTPGELLLLESRPPL